MNILIIGPAFPYRGGIAITNEALCRALIKAGHQASIYTFSLQYPSFLFPGKSQYSDDEAPVDLDITRCINSINPLNWYKLSKKINRLSPDLVLIRYWIPFLAPCLGTIARNLSPQIKILALTDNIIPHEKRLGDKMLSAYFIKPFDGFITMSSTVAKELKELTWSPQLYHPHPMDESYGDKIDKKEAKKHLNLDPNTDYVLFFGLIRKYKGLDLLIKSFAEQPLAKSLAKLLIVGECYEDPKQYFELIENLSLSKRVDFRNQFIPHDQIKYYFSAASLVAQTYLSASQSGITPIAYWFSTPLLVTDVGGLAEMVENEVVGYVVEKNAREIATKIDNYFKENRLDEFSRALDARKKDLTWDHFVNELLAFYDSLNLP